MITIKVENYKHISQDSYNKIINFLDLALVPCPCGHSGCLVRHGTYKRRIQLNDKVLPMTVVRVLCTSCGHTHALLLSSIVPYSQIPLELQAGRFITGIDVFYNDSFFSGPELIRRLSGDSIAVKGEKVHLCKGDE